MFEAQFTGGECHGCGGLIKEGQMIEMSDFFGQGRGWQHVDCPDTEPKPTKFTGTTLEDMGY
jgi:hypothetical protein